MLDLDVNFLDMGKLFEKDLNGDAVHMAKEERRTPIARRLLPLPPALWTSHQCGAATVQQVDWSVFLKLVLCLSFPN